MSRGYGRVEREVLAYFEERLQLPVYRNNPEMPTRLSVIAAEVPRHPESIRRALKSLARKGDLVLGYDSGWRDGGDGLADRFWSGASVTAHLSAARLSTLIPEQQPDQHLDEPEPDEQTTSESVEALVDAFSPRARGHWFGGDL